MTPAERAAAIERARLAIHHWRRQDIPVDPTPVALDVIALAEDLDRLDVADGRVVYCYSCESFVVNCDKPEEHAGA